jgi:ribose transport system ATP-binding protein
LLQIHGVSKRFPGVIALDSVDISLASGEVVALLGENGAGKSTLMKIIGGVYQADAGSLIVDDVPCTFRSPSEALDKGIRVVFQELSVLENLDISENIFLGRELRKAGLVDRKKMRELTVGYLEKVGLKRPPSTPVAALSIAERQLVEIAKAFSMKVRYLILDEPTSSLTLEESNRLFEIITDLKKEGVGIFYISHRLDEIGVVADRVVGLRDGKNAGALTKEEITHEAMVKLMVGREIAPSVNAGPAIASEVVLEIKELRTSRYPNIPVSFSIRAGEILGLAGLVGAGRSEVTRALFGIDPAQGTIALKGETLKVRSPRDAINAGMFLVPEDRRNAGLTTTMSVGENIVLPAWNKFSALGLKKQHPARKYATEGVKQLNVKTPSIDQIAANLSGGNQQKVVLARWLQMNPKVMIIDEPTRGIDVGSKAEIYTELRRLAAQGLAILMVSSDMEEVLAVSDRIGVMHEGHLSGILDRKDATEEAIMNLAVGGAK